MNKIFFEKKYILFGNENIDNLPEVKLIDNEFLNLFMDKNNKTNFFYRSDKDGIIKELVKYSNYIQAAGGIVFSPDKEKIILIKHYNVWDLPKGWIETGETKEKAAIREVSEETGIPFSKILSEFDDTLHFYFYDNKLNLKHTFWFKMLSDKEYPLFPQKEEDISEAEWIKTTDLYLLFDNMYPSVQYLLNNIFI